ncbi:MAG: sigma-70 family RNA polymerase sigma factor [Pyrinomonadaceae bacterium]
MSLVGSGKKSKKNYPYCGLFVEISRYGQKSKILFRGERDMPTTSTTPCDDKNTGILKRIAAGDSSAVEDCIQKYSGLVWAFARKVNSSFEDAEDISQDIFMAIWQNAARFDESIASESTFVSMIARRRVVDRLRQIYRRPKMDPISDHMYLGPSDLSSANNALDASRALAAIGKLRKEQKELIWLNIFEGMSHTEIASQRELPIGTVKTHIRRGLAAAKTLLLEPRENANHVTAY